MSFEAFDRHWDDGRRLQREAARYIRLVWFMLLLSVVGGLVLSGAVVAAIVYLIVHFWG